VTDETDIVDPPVNLYTIPIVVQLTNIIVAAIHREVCDPYVGGDHEAGGAHLPCEYNLRYGGEVYLFMGQPRVER
jgi:hypothetical protein